MKHTDTEALPGKANRGGRPKSPYGANRTVTVKTTLTPLEYAALSTLFNESNHSRMSDFVREAVFNASVTGKVKPEFYEMSRDLMGIGNNLNQAVHLAHISGFAEREKEISKATADVAEMIGRMKKLING